MTPNPTIRSRKSASHTEMSTKDGKLIELQDMDQVPEGDDPESRRQTLAHKQARAQLDPQTQDKSQEAEPKRDRFNSLWRISELTSVHLENKGSIARDHVCN